MKNADRAPQQQKKATSTTITRKYSPAGLDFSARAKAASRPAKTAAATRKRPNPNQRRSMAAPASTARPCVIPSTARIRSAPNTSRTNPAKSHPNLISLALLACAWAFRLEGCRFSYFFNLVESLARLLFAVWLTGFLRSCSMLCRSDIQQITLHQSCQLGEDGEHRYSPIHSPYPCREKAWLFHNQLWAVPYSCLFHDHLLAVPYKLRHPQGEAMHGINPTRRWHISSPCPRREKACLVP